MAYLEAEKREISSAFLFSYIADHGFIYFLIREYFWRTSDRDLGTLSVTTEDSFLSCCHCRADVQMQLLPLLMPHHHMLSFIFLQLNPHSCCHCSQHYHYLYDSCVLFESLARAALLLPCDTSQVSFKGEVERGRSSGDLDLIERTIKPSL